MNEDTNSIQLIMPIANRAIQGNVAMHSLFSFLLLRLLEIRSQYSGSVVPLAMFDISCRNCVSLTEKHWWVNATRGEVCWLARSALAASPPAPHQSWANCWKFPETGARNLSMFRECTFHKQPPPYSGHFAFGHLHDCSHDLTQSQNKRRSEMLRFQVAIRCHFLLLDSLFLPLCVILHTSNVYYLKGHRECAKVHTIHKSTYR